MLLSEYWVLSTDIVNSYPSFPHSVVECPTPQASNKRLRVSRLGLAVPDSHQEARGSGGNVLAYDVTAVEACT